MSGTPTIAEFAYCWLIATSIPMSTQPPQRRSQRNTSTTTKATPSTAVTKKPSKKVPNSSRLLASESPKKMGSQKRPASQASPRESKRTKVSSDFDEELDEFLNLLDDMYKAYSFVPNSHHYKVGPAEAIFQAPLLNSLLKNSKQQRKDILRYLRGADLSFPSYRAMRNEFKACFPGPFNDIAESLQSALATKRDTLLEMGDLLFPPISLPSPSAFGKRHGWHAMQANDTVAILCHRPANRRPLLALKVKHLAFYEFFNQLSATPTIAELGRFRLAAKNLGLKLCAPLEQEASRGSDILRVFQDLFPETDGYTWILEDHHQQGRIDLLCSKTTDGGGSCPWIMIEVKLEPGTNGDGQLQLCRMYDDYVRERKNIHTSGVPMFLLSISGMPVV